MSALRGFAFWRVETVAGQGCTMGAIAIALRGDRGLELIVYRVKHGYRVIAIALRGDRGLELDMKVVADWELLIAIALRGDRGLEPSHATHPLALISYCDRSSGRSRIGTA